MVQGVWQKMKERVEDYKEGMGFDLRSLIVDQPLDREPESPPSKIDGCSTVDDLRQYYETGDERLQKDAALYSLQIAFDAAVKGDIKPEEYYDIEQMAYDHVQEYYTEEDIQTDLIVPDVDRKTTEFRYHGHEEEFMQRYSGESFDEVDRIVAVASSGIEPGMVAAAVTDTEYHIVRYSRRRRFDTDVIDFDPEYDDETIALIDDEAATGKTLQQVREYLEDHGAVVREEPFIDSREASVLDISPLRQGVWTSS